MRIRPWSKMPSYWILDKSMPTMFTGRADRSASISALMLWIFLITRADEQRDEEDKTSHFKVKVTYTDIGNSTNLCRKLISNGISALRDRSLIDVEKSGNYNIYRIRAFTKPGGWCKLPSRALYNHNGVIAAFKHFEKRSIHELDALKLYLYYASIRTNSKDFSQASFEKICEMTGIPEKRIPRGNSFLCTTQLISHISQEQPAEVLTKEPNRYYLTGYRDLFVGR